MMTSWTVVPVDMAPAEDTTNSEVKPQVPRDESGVSEDKLGDANVDSTAGDNNGNSEDQNLAEKVTEKTEETSEGENPATDMEEKKNDSDESQTSQTPGDVNGNSEGGDANTEGGETNGQDRNSEQNSEGTANSEEQPSGEKKQEQDEKSDDTLLQVEKGRGGVEEKADDNQGKADEQKSDENQTGNHAKEEVFPDGAQSEILKETNTSNGDWKTQAAESKNENEVQKSSSKGQIVEYSWKLCNSTAGADYIPCLDNVEAIRKLHSTKHYEHRERHCPEEGPSCLVPLPEGYKRPIKWPNSRYKVWFGLCLIKLNFKNYDHIFGSYSSFLF